MIALPAVETVKRAATLLAVLAAALFVLAGTGWLISRFFPRHDPTPIVVARQDERKAADTSDAIGNAVAAQTRDSTVHVDITTKEIHDAFQAPPPAQPAPAAGAPAALSAAPVDRLRERINEGIARANRAAGPAEAPR